MEKFKPIGPKNFFYEYEFDYSKPQDARVLLLQQRFGLISSNEIDGMATYSVCYGYSGGGIQGDFFFKNHISSTLGHRIFFTDATGDEWHGIRSPKNDKFVEEPKENLEWTDFDRFSYDYLMKDWGKYFTLDEDEINIVPSKPYLKKILSTENGVYSSKEFDYQCLKHFSSIWNFLTTY